MSSAGSPLDTAARLRIGLAIVLPPLAWFVFAVGLAAALRASCSAVGAGLGVGWGVASLLACGLAAWLAWPMAKPGRNRSLSAPWLARIALGAAGIFALAIGLQTAATLVVPPCAR